jgi:hypothetical protein
MFLLLLLLLEVDDSDWAQVVPPPGTTASWPLVEGSARSGSTFLQQRVAYSSEKHITSHRPLISVHNVITMA